MRPASIISLIVAVMLFIAGFVTCTIAQNMAEAAGEQLFAESRDYGLVNTIDLADTAISKLEISVKDAVVNVYGNCESSYIELVNFRENYYSFSSANRVVSFDEIPDATSMLKFWENGFSFKGMRYLLDPSEEPEGEKVINVYLGGTNTDLKILNVTGENCRLTLDKLVSGSDFNINITDTGSVTTSTIRTSSAMNITGGELTLAMQNTTIANLKIECETLTMTGKGVTGTMTDIRFNTGSVDLMPHSSIASLNYSIVMNTGEVTVNGNMLGSSFVQNISANNLFSITAEDGQVTLTDPDNDVLTGNYAFSGMETEAVTPEP